MGGEKGGVGTAWGVLRKEGVAAGSRVWRVRCSSAPQRVVTLLVLQTTIHDIGARR